MVMGTELMEAVQAPTREPQPTTAPPAAGSGVGALLLAGVSGVLLWACFHPLNLGWLAWVALVPLLPLVRATGRPRLIYGSAWLAGLIFFVPALQWMRVADDRMYATWLLLALYCSLYFPVAIWLLRRLDVRTRLPLVVTVPAVWVGLEYVRSFALSGFAWYFLGHTQHEYLSIIQVTDLGGVYTVSLLVAAVNALLFDLLYQLTAVRAALRLIDIDPLRRLCSVDYFNREIFDGWAFRKNLLAEAAAIIVLIVAAYGYGQYRLGQNQFEAGPIVSLLQGNLDQRLRNEASQPGGGNHRETITAHYAALCYQAMRQAPRPALVVWPETSYPHEWFEAAAELPVADVPQVWRDAEVGIREHLRGLAGLTPTHHLLGMNANVLDPDRRHRRYNSALLLTPHGTVDARFDKMHRVPFGEYVPFKDWLPVMNALAPYDFDYSIRPGETFTRFPLGDHKFGVLVCYEDTDPALARQYVTDNDGPPVDFLVNISNDGWFDGSDEHEAHLAISRFRAIECRRALARSVNMGISAVIDGNGRVLKPRRLTHDEGPPIYSTMAETGPAPDLPAAEWGAFKQTAGVFTAAVPLDRRTSLYGRFGDWLPIGCWLVLAAGLVTPLVRSRRP